MTIPATTWCPVCQEDMSGQQQHATVCTVCGTTLTVAPPTSTTAAAAPTVSLLPTLQEALGNDSQNVNAHDLRILMTQLQRRIDTVGHLQDRLLHELQDMGVALGGEQGGIPAAWLDPNQADTTPSHPTSQSYLRNLPRFVLQPHSALLWQADVRIEASSSTDSWTTPATVADWGIPYPAGDYQGQLVMRTSTATNTTDTSSSHPVIYYADRGQGETFVAMAQQAQQAVGAVACLIGNHVSEPWPFYMQNSSPKQHASTDSTRVPTIPTVLLPKAAAVQLRRQFATSHTIQITLHLQPSPHRDCVICTVALSPTETVLQLPVCGHMFHTTCIEPWLTTHHTCPTCRAPLPTDDADYDRAVQRQREASTSNSNPTDAWYG